MSLLLINFEAKKARISPFYNFNNHFRILSKNFCRTYEIKKEFYHFNNLIFIMMKIEAVIRSSVLHEVQDALAKIGIPTFSSYQVQITGIHRTHEGLRNKTSDFIPKIKIEILCSEDEEENIISTIQTNASTGEKGDGVVFTYNIDNLVKIRSGQTGKDALK